MCLGILVYGFSAWKYRNGSADAIRSILNDTGMTAAISAVAALLGGLYSGLAGVRSPFEGAGLLIVIWVGFVFVEWKKSLAVSVVAQAPQSTETTSVNHHQSKVATETFPREKELEKKSWFRFCKLCYGFAYVVSLMIAWAIGYAKFPVEYIDSDRSVIQCADGKQYSASAVSGYFFTSQLNSYNDEKARKLCTMPDIFDELMPDPKSAIAQRKDIFDELLPDTAANSKPEPSFDVIEINRNYTFISAKAVRGSYATLFWGLGIVVLAGEIIRRSFLYVVAGVPFFDFSMLKRG